MPNSQSPSVASICSPTPQAPSVDTTFLSQIVPLYRRPKGKVRQEPVLIRSRDISVALDLKAERIVDLVRPFGVIRDKAVVGEGLDLGKLASELLRSRQNLTAGRLPNRQQIDLLLKEMKARNSSAGSARSGAAVALGSNQIIAPPVRPLVNALDLMERLASLLPTLSVSDAISPGLGVEVTYRQDWQVKGYGRGRLIRSIPLTADGRTEISIKTWETRKERRTENTSVENDISNEIIGDEKWSHAVSKQLSAQLNQSITASVGANGSIPLPGATIGANANTTSQTSGSIQQIVTDTSEQVHQLTNKTSEALRKRFSSAVETAEESGLEAIERQVIVNPNKCNTLTYHFYEVSEQYEVTTKVEQVTPLLLLPLAYPVPDAAWLLCHECLLKKYLPCETYYAGFEAARLVLSRERLGEALGDLDDPVIKAQANAVLAAMQKIVSLYQKLANANVTVAANAASATAPIEAAVDDLLKGLGDLGTAAAKTVESGVDFAADAVEAAGKAVAEVGAVIGEGIEWITSLSPFVASGQVTTLATVPLGLGSAIWWRVARIAAPELEAALSQLAGSLDNLPSTDGPAKVAAILEAATSFQTTLGDVNELFRRVEIGLGILAGILSVSVFAGAVAVIALVGAVVTISNVVGVVLLGAAAVLAIGQFAVVIGSILAGDPGVDLIPNDLGLRQAIGSLNGQTRQLAAAVAEPVAPETDDPALLAIFREEQIVAKQERRQLAEAGVELDRLLCHINENISHYAQITLSAIPSADLDRILQDDFAVPPGIVEPRIVGFSGHRAAFRLHSDNWIKLSGIDLIAALKASGLANLIKTTALKSDITMPSRGILVEPELGQCPASDAFVAFHRDQDMALKKEEVAQAALETRRLQERLNARLFADPTPFDGVEKIGLTTSVADTPTPAPGTTTPANP
ncbi:hypothetical protein [Roseibium suaedae]|uniref:Uncharacterized protein n=1 Tax=Roseibium suaedae TaxID=735517 RepID=A0A1M7G1A2_9HYPH|nr:hypothetical protein [Roseibium suaedae]SHM10030.1 hypothetical protein SAMN05444272_1776 [Roseibium suaedae]